MLLFWKRKVSGKCFLWEDCTLTKSFTCMQLLNISRGSRVMQMLLIYYSESTGGIRDQLCSLPECEAAVVLWETFDQNSGTLLLVLQFSSSLCVGSFLFSRPGNLTSFSVQDMTQSATRQLSCTDSCFDVDHKAVTSNGAPAWSLGIFFFFFVSWVRWLPCAGGLKRVIKRKSRHVLHLDKLRCFCKLKILKCPPILTWIQLSHPC